MPRASAYDNALNAVAKADSGVQYYFDLLVEILENVSRPEPALAYCFQRIESAQRVSLYVLLMRKYRTDSRIAWSVIDNLDLTRKNFPEHYEALTGHRIAEVISKSLKQAMTVRDRITHGKSASDNEIYRAISDCIAYAAALNVKFKAEAGFCPFGPLRGVTSSRRPQLSPDISRLVIKGLGL